MADESQAQADKINSLIASDPQLKQWVAMIQSGDTTGTTDAFNTPSTWIAQRLKQLGVEVPKDYWLSNGQVQKQSFFNRNMDWLVPAMIVGGGVGIGALGAAGAPAAAAASSGGTAAGGTGAGVTGAALTTGASAAAPSLWSKIAGPLVSAGIPAATNLIGTSMQVGANERAAELQAQAAQKALDWQKQQYGVRQEQLAPTIGVGNAARTRLGDLMGLQAPEGGYHAPAVTQPNGVQVGAPGALTNIQTNPSVPPAGQPSAAPQMVTMKAPTGQVSSVPSDQVPHYQSLGAQVVGAGA